MMEEAIVTRILKKRNGRRRGRKRIALHIGDELQARHVTRAGLGAVGALRKKRK